MSQENVVVVRELYAGWVRGDFSVGREEGKCVRLDYYGSKEQALEAAGLAK